MWLWFVVLSLLRWDDSHFFYFKVWSGAYLIRGGDSSDRPPHSHGRDLFGVFGKPSPQFTSPFIPSHLLVVGSVSAESFTLFVADLLPVLCSDAQQKWHLFFFSGNPLYTHHLSSVVSRSDRSRWLCSARRNIAAERKCIMRLLFDSKHHIRVF